MRSHAAAPIPEAAPPSRRCLEAFETHERRGDGMLPRVDDGAGNRVARDDCHWPRNRAGFEARLERRREIRLLDRDAVPQRARLFELELAVLARDGRARHDAI